MSGSIDRRSDRPAYRQIADSLRRDITEGELEAGSKLPSERMLIDRFDASRGTVRQALGLLKSEGLIESQHGRGVFVRERPPIRRKAHDRFLRRHRDEGRAAYLAEMQAEGREPRVEVFALGETEARGRVAELLDVPQGTTVFHRARRYFSDGTPVETATSYLPLELVEGTRIVEEDTGPGGIYARLEDEGNRLESFTEEVAARMPHPQEADMLELAPGVPVLHVLRTALRVDGTPVEVCDTLMAADRYVLSYQLPAE